MRKLKLFLFFMCKVTGLFRLARRATRRHLKILCYHGFALGDEAEFRPKLYITPGSFEQRLAAIHRYGMRVLPLDEAVERLYSRTLPDHALAITIDDGFHATHGLAAPRLRRHGYPATVYLTTYYVEHPVPIFGLAVQYMFWKTRLRRLVLTGVPWHPDATVDLDDSAARERAMSACIEFGRRQDTEAQRQAVCEDLGARLDVSYREIAATKILHLMSPEELAALAGMGVDIQLHTHRHVFPDDRARAEREIADNRRALERCLDGAPKRHFCYPSGLWTERQHAWLDGLDIASSATCLPGLNSERTPRHALRRFLDGENIHPLEFEAALSGFSDLLRRLRPGS